MRDELSYSGLQLLLAVRAFRRLGIETASALVGTTEAELEAGRPSVPWDDALAWFRSLEGPNLTPEAANGFAREFIGSHPIVRATAQLFVTPISWLDFFWAVSSRFSNGAPAHYVITDQHHELRVSMVEGCRGSWAYLLLTHFAAVHAPTVMAAEPLSVLSLEYDDFELRATYAPPIDHSFEERRRAASGLPMSVVLASLELLGQSAAGLLRDGHLLVPRGFEQPLDEVVRLSGDWGLTPTEARVALCLAEGRSPRAVAEELGISVGTVRVHLKHTYAKTETAGQRELVARVQGWQLP